MIHKLLDKYRNMSKPAKAAIWFVACNFIVKGISFITAPIFARILPTDEYGVFSVFSSYEQIIIVLATWEIQLGAFQKGLFKYEGEEKLFSYSTQALINILTIAFSLVILVFFKPIQQFTGMTTGIFILLFAYLIVYPSYIMWSTEKRKSYDYKPVVLMTVLFTVVNVTLPLIAVFIIQKSANIKFIFTLIGSILICFFFFIRYCKYHKLVANKDKVKEYWKFCIKFEGPIVLHSLSFFLLGQSDRIMVSHMVGNTEAAFYSAAGSIASVITLFVTAINQSFTPWRYEMLKNKKYEEIRKNSNIIIIGLGVMMIAFILVVPEVLTLLFSSKYDQALTCIPSLVVGTYFVFLYTIFVSIESYYEKTIYILIVSVTCSIINIVLNYLLIPVFGYAVCAYTTMVSYALFALMHYFFARKVLKPFGAEKRSIDSRFILLTSLSIVVMTQGIQLLYGLPFVRYGIFAVILVACIIKRKSIIAFYKRLNNKAAD